MVNLTITPKQVEILKALENKIHTEVFAGGAAGGSKSFTGCLWQVSRRLKYPNSRGFLARARLKDLKVSTLLTFFEVCRMLGLEIGKDYTYNAQSGVIKFSNGSEEYLKDLFLYPSDPEFVGLGSTEYTDGFIDEMGEITNQAYEIIKSRIRFKLDEFGLIPKVFMGSNPCKTFVYPEFYKKWRDGELEPYKCYIPASVYDNPFISDHYIENLKKLGKVNRERLLNGNWEYDNDPSKLFDYDKIIDIFTNEYVAKPREQMYISCDVARFGADKTVIAIWRGLYIVSLRSYPKTSGPQVQTLLLGLSEQYKVPRSNIVIDDDGVGGMGVVDWLPGCKPFINNSSPKETEGSKKRHNYKNLKTQCYFKLAELVKNGDVGCYSDVPDEFRLLLIEDLEQVAQKDIDLDEKKIQLVSKEEIKLLLRGRSPDYADALCMRMLFELTQFYRPYLAK